MELAHRIRKHYQAGIIIAALLFSQIPFASAAKPLPQRSVYLGKGFSAELCRAYGINLLPHSTGSYVTPQVTKKGVKYGWNGVYVESDTVRYPLEPDENSSVYAGPIRSWVTRFTNNSDYPMVHAAVICEEDGF